MSDEANHLTCMLGDVPDIMKQLTKEFINKTELSERAKIRLRMKALLDFISVDTTYPKVPNLDGRPPAPTLPAIGQALQQPPAAPGSTLTGIPLHPAPGLVAP